MDPSIREGQVEKVDVKGAPSSGYHFGKRQLGQPAGTAGGNCLGLALLTSSFST